MSRSAILPLTLALVLAGTAAQAAGVTVAISCGSVGAELELCQEGAEAWAAKTGNTVKVVADAATRPPSSLALYQQILTAGSRDIDVFQIDVVWPGILASHFLDLKPSIDPGRRVDRAFPGDHRQQHGRRQAGGDALVHRCRPALLPQGPARQIRLKRAGDLGGADRRPPRRSRRASAAGNDRFWGFVLQGRAYEGLTCNALEWIASFGGGTIVDADGKITINNPQAAAALDLAASWIGTIAPDGVLNYGEEEARGVFQSGNAVFMRNWPYAWALANAADSPIKDKVGVAPLPKGGDEAASTPARSAAGSSRSRNIRRNPKEAADLVRYLTSAEEQKRRAIKGSFNPTIGASTRTRSAAAQPVLRSRSTTSSSAPWPGRRRVTGERYNQVSRRVLRAVHDDAVEATATPPTNLARAGPTTSTG